MRALVLLGVAAMLPCASDAAEPTSQTAVPAVAEVTADTKAPENVRTVTLDPNERRPVCRRHVPTGSRIAEQRCESADEGAHRRRSRQPRHLAPRPRRDARSASDARASPATGNGRSRCAGAASISRPAKPRLGGYLISMTEYVTHGGIKIARSLHDLVRDEIAPGTGIAPDTVWTLLDSIVRTLGPRNRALLEKRDALQAKIDAWLGAAAARHSSRRRPPLTCARSATSCPSGRRSR